MFIWIGWRLALAHAPLHFIFVHSTMLLGPPPTPPPSSTLMALVNLRCRKKQREFREWQTIVDLKLLPNKITIKTNRCEDSPPSDWQRYAFFSSNIHNLRIYVLFIRIRIVKLFIARLSSSFRSAVPVRITMFQSNEFILPPLVSSSSFARPYSVIRPLSSHHFADNSNLSMHIEYFSVFIVIIVLFSAFCFLIWQLTQWSNKQFNIGRNRRRWSIPIPIPTQDCLV